MWNPSAATVLIILEFLLILPQSQSCQKKHLQNFLGDGKKGGGGLEPEIHHHNYHHHYDKDGHEIPPPQPHPNAEVLRGGNYYGDGVEQVSSVDGDYPAKHVVVLQQAPPPGDEDFFDSFIPKKFHPKHIFKNQFHKLRDRFRDLLGEKKQSVHAKHAYIHGGKHAQGPAHPPRHYSPHPQGGNVAVPALKVPLVQVEAYKPASPYDHPDAHRHPGGQKAVAYISPDGYKPAVVVKSNPYHPPGHPPHNPPGHPPQHPPHHPHPHHQPRHPPPPEEYEYQPQQVVYEEPHRKHPQLVAYQPEDPHQPVAYHHPQPQPQPQVTVQVQPQVSHVTYSSPEESSPYHQHQSLRSSVPVYGPQQSSPQSQPYHPFGSQKTVSTYQTFGASPYASDSSSPFGSSSSSIFQ